MTKAKHVYHHHHHHRWQNSPFPAIIFVRKICQISSGVQFLDFSTFIFNRARSSALHPGRPGPCIYAPPPVTMWPSYSFSVAFYDSQGCGGGILTHHNETSLELPIFMENRVVFRWSSAHVWKTHSAWTHKPLTRQPLRKQPLRKSENAVTYEY